MEMTSNQPYLFRAIFDWIVDNGATPYVLVDATGEHVKVPQQSIQNGQIVLNLAPRAVTNFHADESSVSFSARFSGIPQQIYIPIQHILAIYAAENGQGMVFSHDYETNESAETNRESEIADVAVDNQNSNQTDVDSASKPFLKVIK